MTAYTPQAIEIIGPVREERWGSVGFRLNDRFAPHDCRAAALQMLKEFELLWVPSLEESVATIVSELVTNAQRYGGDAFPAGSLTMWHPNEWLVVAVHDKNPYRPYRELLRSRQAVQAGEWSEESGRGLGIVQRLAEEHCGELDFGGDWDRANPGKVARVRMLLPDVLWPHRFKDPWKDRHVEGRGYRA